MNQTPLDISGVPPVDTVSDSKEDIDEEGVPPARQSSEVGRKNKAPARPKTTPSKKKV